MVTPNPELIDKARATLRGRWAPAIGTYLVLVLLTGLPGSIKYAGGIISLLIAGPFALGAAIYTLSLSRKEHPRLEMIFDGFKQYARATVTLLWLVLYIVLWSLLLVVPGIIAALGYSMTFFVLADNPALEPRQAMQRSKQLMDGYKLKFFGLGLLFMLLSIACIFTLGIGFLWLIPLMYVSTAAFYRDILENEKQQQAV